MHEELAGSAGWVRKALDRYEVPLIRYATRMVGDADRARDVVQDTFLRLCTADEAKLNGHLAPWLYRVCRNRALDVLKKEKRMQPTDTATMARHASPAAVPRAVAEDRETGDEVLRALGTLPEKQQEVFRLKFQAQLSYKEIMGVTGYSLNHVKYLMHNALKSMREQLQGQYDLVKES
jgi:RNA polymerase sigma factor (sigma-70 family)